MKFPPEIWRMIYVFRKNAFKKRCDDVESMLYDLYTTCIRRISNQVGGAVHVEQISTYSFYGPSIRFQIEVIKEYGTGLEYMSRLFYTIPYRETDYGVITEKTYFKLDDGTFRRAQVFY